MSADPNPFTPPEADIPVTPSSDRPPVNVWREIWLHPRPTIRALLDWRPSYRIYPLAVLHGFVMVVGIARPPLPRDIQTAAAMGMGLFIWGLLGVLWLHLLAGALRFTGRLAGGKGEPRDLRCAAAWGFAPAVVETPVRSAEWQGWLPYDLGSLLLLLLMAAGTWIGVSASLEAHRFSRDNRPQGVAALLLTWLFLEAVLFRQAGHWINQAIRWMSFMFFPYQ